MEAKNLNLQKNFELFKIGDLVTGVIDEVDPDKLWIKFRGGAWGIIPQSALSNYKNLNVVIREGREYDFIIENIQDGVPVLELPFDVILKKCRVEANVRICGTQKIVVSFCINGQECVGCYDIKETDTDLKDLKENDKVECIGFTMNTKSDVLTVQSLIRKTPKAAANEDSKTSKEKKLCVKAKSLPASLPENYNGYISIGAIKLGEYYIIQALDTRELVFEDNTKAYLNGKDLPENAYNNSFYLGIVSKISEDQKFYVELKKKVDAAFVEKFNQERQADYRPLLNKNKKRSVSIIHGCLFGKRDEEIYAKARQDNSLNRYERYWLGFCYKTAVQAGKIYLQANNGNKIEVIIDNASYLKKNAKEAIIAISHINVNGNTPKINVNVKYSE